MQLEASASEQGGGEEEEDEEEDTVDGSPEIRLVPSDSAAGKSSNITGVCVYELAQCWQYVDNFCVIAV